MKLKVKNLTIDYDKDYGIQCRTGWSIAINGSYLVQFEKWLVVALMKAFYKEWGYRHEA